ncbi:MAG: LysR substrate-binding domain-containing protein [Pseudomonadota bacterium]
MKLHHLRNLVAVADANSIRGAARAQGLAQPAITRGLRDLEKELGVPLLERHGKGVSLNAYGQSFVVRARSILQDVERGRQEIEQLKGRGEGRVSAGLSGAVFLALVPQVYKGFRMEYPDARLSLTEGLFPAMEPQLKDGSLDFYVGPRPVGDIDRFYKAELLFHNPRVVVARKGHPLGNARSLRELTGAEWIMTGVRQPVDVEFVEQFAVHGLPAPRSVTETLTTLPLVALLTSTDTLAFLPPQWTSNALFRDSLQQIAVEEELQGPDIVLIRRSAMPLTPMAEKLATLFERASGTPFKSDQTSVMAGEGVGQTG